MHTASLQCFSANFGGKVDWEDERKGKNRAFVVITGCPRLQHRHNNNGNSKSAFIYWPWWPVDGRLRQTVIQSVWAASDNPRHRWQTVSMSLCRKSASPALSSFASLLLIDLHLTFWQNIRTSPISCYAFHYSFFSFSCSITIASHCSSFRPASESKISQIFYVLTNNLILLLSQSGFARKVMHVWHMQIRLSSHLIKLIFIRRRVWSTPCDSEHISPSINRLAINCHTLYSALDVSRNLREERVKREGETSPKGSKLRKTERGD